MNKLICVAYISVIIGMTVGSVGEMPRSPAEPFKWWLPFAVFAMMAIPSVLAYLAGRDDATAEGKR